MKYTLLINPIAGNGIAKRAAHELKNVLVQNDLYGQEFFSKYPGQLKLLSRKLADQKLSDQHLIIVGGDGSFNEALTGIKNSQHSETALAFFPAGTGNDFARAAKLPKIVQDYYQQILKTPQIVATYCGQYHILSEDTQRIGYFINNFGIGSDAFIVHKSNHSKLKPVLNKLKMGNLIYGSNIIKALKQVQPFAITVVHHQQHYHFDHSYLVTTTNHPFFGGGVALLPPANIHDGKLHCVVVEEVETRKFIHLFAKLLKDGPHVSDPHFHDISGTELEVKVAAPEYAQIYGEDQEKECFHVKFKKTTFNLIH